VRLGTARATAPDRGGEGEARKYQNPKNPEARKADSKRHIKDMEKQESNQERRRGGQLREAQLAGEGR